MLGLPFRFKVNLSHSQTQNLKNALLYNLGREHRNSLQYQLSYRNDENLPDARCCRGFKIQESALD